MSSPPSSVSVRHLRLAVVGLGANTLKHHVPKLLATRRVPTSSTNSSSSSSSSPSSSSSGSSSGSSSSSEPSAAAVDVRVDLVAVANRSGASGRQAVAKWQAESLRESAKNGSNVSSAGDAGSSSSGVFVAEDGRWMDVLKPELGVDVVVCGTWPFVHRQVVEASLRAGKHVLCEARMAMNAAEARSMLQVKREHPDLVAMLVPSPFTLQHDSAIRKILRSGQLGRLVSIDVLGQQCAWCDAASPAPISWRQREDFSGDNALMMGIFYEALVRWVGEAESVMALGQTNVPLRPETADADAPLVSTRIPDHLDVLGSMVCGAQLRMQFSSVQGTPTAFNHFTLYGTDGTLRFQLTPEGPQLAVALKSDAAGGAATMAGGSDPSDVKWNVVEPEEGAAGWRVEEEFLGAVAGVEPVKYTTFEDGVKYMEFTSAVAQSLREQRLVKLGNPFA